MTHLDLFSGIGGFALAARWAGLETIQFVEYEPFCQQVLTKNFPGVPIHDDIKNFSADGIVSPFLLTGGYPCQPFSQAGKRRGKEDDRHLWPEMLRVIRECRPTWVLAENVSGHIKLGLEEVLLDLESEGYDSQVFHIGAVAKDAPHRRMRLWIVAHSKYSADRTNGGKEGEEDSIQVINRQEGLSGVSGRTGSDTKDVAYSESEGTWEDNRRLWEGISRTGRREGTSEDVANTQSTRFQTRSSDRVGTEHGSRRDKGQSAGSCGETEDVAYSNDNRSKIGHSECSKQDRERETDNALSCSKVVSNSNDKRLEGHNDRESTSLQTEPIQANSGAEDKCEWGDKGIAQPGLGRTLSDGLSLWMDEPDIP